MNDSDSNNVFLPDIASQIMRSAQAGRIVHAMIFSGPRGTGRHETATHFACFMMCSSLDKPCGKCNNCKRVRNGIHPDVISVSLQEKQRTIGIEKVRTLISSIAVRPFEGGNRIVIIESADLLTVQAQNALLKTLEDARPTDYFILITEHDSLLLPTIRSRARSFRFSPLPPDQCRDRLIRDGMDKTRAAIAASIANGAYERAKGVQTDLWQKVVLFAQALAHRDIIAAVASLPSVESSTVPEELLDCLTTWARQKMMHDSGCGELSLIDRSDFASGPDGKKMLLAIKELRSKLDSNMNWQHAIESVCLKLTEDNPVWQL